MVVLQELYMSSMLVSSTCSVDSSCIGADGCWSKKCSNCCVLASCLLKAFQWCSRCPRETCAVMIQEWCVGYACRTGWKMTDSPSSFPDEFVVGVSMNRVCNGDVWWLLTVLFFYDPSISFMVGKFMGLLTYHPALPNWVSIFQNSMGGSNMISDTLQDHNFPVAWFLICMKCLLHSMWTILYLGLHFKFHLPGCLFSKYTWSPTWKAGFSHTIVFWAVLNLFSSNVFFAIANANLCASRFSIPECARAQSISQHVDAGQLNVPP